MIGMSFYLLVKSAIFFSFIFWALSFSFKYFYSDKKNLHKNDFYECGFSSLTNIKIKFNVNFLLILLFVLIYDGEFLLLIPFSFNLELLTIISLFLIDFFSVFLLVILLIDYLSNSVEWHI